MNRPVQFFYYSDARAEMRVRAGQTSVFASEPFHSAGVGREGLTMAGNDNGGPGAGEAEKPKVLSPEAQRALAEAEERRRMRSDRVAAAKSTGPKDRSPIRYGDWERKGIASDF